MTKSLPILLCGVAFGAGSVWSFQGAVRRSSYSDEVHGFKVDVPRFPDRGQSANTVAAVFSGPPNGGPASNVNVMVQRTRTTRKDYRETTLGQLKQLGLKINSDRDLAVSGREAVEFDYVGKFPGSAKDLRFLALAVIEPERVILVTCTAGLDDFPGIEDEFRACLASLRLNSANP